MKSLYKKIILSAALAAVGLAGAYAEEYLSAADLTAGAITAALEAEGFTVYARSDKNVTVEAMDPGRTAADGEVFTARIKLNGGGAVDFRSIGFSAKTGAVVTIYLNSSSKTDARVLKVTDEAGNVLAELVAPPDVGAVAGTATFTVPKDGKYFVFSAASGINIYLIDIE